MREINERLIECRKLLGIGQKEFAVLGGVSYRTQQNYENIDRYPDALYLSKLAKIGVDVQYIITGARSTEALTDDQQELIELYIKADISKKAAIMGVARSDASDMDKETRTINNHGQYSEGSINNTISGDMHVGGTKKKK